MQVCRGFAVCPETDGLLSIRSQQAAGRLSLDGRPAAGYTYIRSDVAQMRVWRQIHTVAEHNGWTIDVSVDLPMGQQTVPPAVTDLMKTWRWTAGSSVNDLCGADPPWVKEAPIHSVSGASYPQVYLQKADSVWVDGAVPTDTCDWSSFAVSTAYNASLQRPMILFGAVGAPEQWVVPRNVGRVTITAATGPDGLVSFSSTSGVKGTFDLRHHAWTFQ